MARPFCVLPHPMRVTQFPKPPQAFPNVEREKSGAPVTVSFAGTGRSRAGHSAFTSRLRSSNSGGSSMLRTVKIIPRHVNLLRVGIRHSANPTPRTAQDLRSQPSKMSRSSNPAYRYEMDETGTTVSQYDMYSGALLNTFRNAPLTAGE